MSLKQLTPRKILAEPISLGQKIALELREIAKLKPITEQVSKFKFLKVDLEWILEHCAQQPHSKICGCQVPVLTTFFSHPTPVKANAAKEGKIDRGSTRSTLFKCNFDEDCRDKGCLERLKAQLGPNELKNCIENELYERRRAFPQLMASELAKRGQKNIQEIQMDV